MTMENRKSRDLINKNSNSFGEIGKTPEEKSKYDSGRKKYFLDEEVKPLFTRT